MNPVSVVQGDGPIVLAQPHSGTAIPPEIFANLNETGQELRDTDWHIPTLYDGLLPDATVVQANFSRYVIDPNRDPEGVSLYPGQQTTELVPTTTFDGEPIWERKPTDDDIAYRKVVFHQPYHDALALELERVKTHYGFVLLYDCHSIRSVIPHLFEGVLPDLNIGTNAETSCAPALRQAVVSACEQQSVFTHVADARFKGGWTTRHHGRPETGVHALQMELAQTNYLQKEEKPFVYDEERAKGLRDLLRMILSDLRYTLEQDFNREVRHGQNAVQ
ncbi:MAG: N-formylglutamate deformylase [Pseudomonadota bacterium]